MTYDPSRGNEKELIELDVRIAAASVNGLVVNQPDIEFSEEGLDRADGVHISNVGNAILTNTFQSAI